jgi:hypothetical protein
MIDTQIQTQIAELTVTIPLTSGSLGAWPVSVNQMYKMLPNGQKAKTPAAAAWHHTVCDYAWAELIKSEYRAIVRHVGRFGLELVWRFGRNQCRFDADNLHKLVQDAVWDALNRVRFGIDVERANDRDCDVLGDCIVRAPNEPARLTIRLVALANQEETS